MTRRVALGLFALAAALGAKKKDKKKSKRKAQPNLGLLAGTVFDPDGRSARGAKVTVFDVDDPSIRFETVSDSRGEFAIRAPAAADPATARRYRVIARVKGFPAVEKTAEVYLAQRTNVNLILKRP